MATSSDRERLEGFHTIHQMTELRLDPVRGNFGLEAHRNEKPGHASD